MQPHKNVKRTAKSAPRPLTYFCVINAIMAVGPIVRSLQLPKNKYMKHPIKPE